MGACVFDNLLASWVALDPSEIVLKKNCHGHKDRNFYFLSNGELCIESEGDFSDRALSGLIVLLLKCLSDRNLKWTFDSDSQGYSISLFDKENKQFYAEDRVSICKVLLVVYLSYLSAQRSIVSGHWRHFKGGTASVRGGVAKWSGVSIDPRSFAAIYQAEESQESDLQLILKPGTDDCWLYNASKDFGDRVFYLEENGLWARHIDVFLSLVGSNLEHEGKLRFAKEF